MAEKKPAEGKKPAEDTKTKREGKRVRTGRKHESKSPKDFYEVQGNEIIRKRKSCPRCGEGIWLAKHKNRLCCGRCGYTIFEGKTSKRADEGERPTEPQ